MNLSIAPLIETVSGLLLVAGSYIAYLRLAHSPAGSLDRIEEGIACRRQVMQLKWTRISFGAFLTIGILLAYRIPGAAGLAARLALSSFVATEVARRFAVATAIASSCRLAEPGHFRVSSSAILMIMALTLGLGLAHAGAWLLARSADTAVALRHLPLCLSAAPLLAWAVAAISGRTADEVVMARRRPLLFVGGLSGTIAQLATGLTVMLQY